jgi:hypothetical protein
MLTLLNQKQNSTTPINPKDKSGFQIYVPTCDCDCDCSTGVCICKTSDGGTCTCNCNCHPASAPYTT